MRKQYPTFLILAIPVVCLLCAITYFLPPVNERLAWRVDELRTRVKYALNPDFRIVLHLFVHHDQECPEIDIIIDYEMFRK